MTERSRQVAYRKNRPIAAYLYLSQPWASDNRHEDRFILIGYSHRPRLPYAVHAEVRQDVIRIISARRATSHEKAHYEND